MALRAGYKGFKKLINGLKVLRPGVLGIDIGTGLAIGQDGKLNVTGSGGTTVVANPEGEATSDLNKLQVGEAIYGIPEGTDVEANPTGSATSDLTKLKVGNAIYGIPEGTDVEANPSGSAADNLTKLKVGNDIYGVLDFDSLNYSMQGLTFPAGECEYVAGGYIKIGKLVFVNIRFKVTHRDGVCSIYGFPSYTNRTTDNKVLVISSYVSTTGIDNAYIASNGTLAIPAAVTVNSEFVFNGVYLAD